MRCWKATCRTSFRRRAAFARIPTSSRAAASAPTSSSRCVSLRAAWSIRSGQSVTRTCRSRPRKNSSFSPRSSRRKLARMTSARMSPRSSSTACSAACACNPTPTIVYGIFGGDGKPSDRPIYKSDLAKQTPYNTYQIKGPAADAHRQSGPCGTGSCCQSVAHQGSVFRGGRHRWPCFCSDARRA